MRNVTIVVCLLTALLAGGTAGAQAPAGPTLEFEFEGLSVLVPRIGARVELLPVLRLLGAEAAFSPAAGTFGVTHGDHIIQFSPEHRYILVDGDLQEISDPPVPSPGGVAASLGFLEKVVLRALGYHLEPTARGYRVAAGARYGEPVTVRAAAVDFGATTTLVLTLDRKTEAAVEEDEEDGLIVVFDDALPQVDRTVGLRSVRVRSVHTRDEKLLVDLASGVGMLSWHRLEEPARVIVELGKKRAVPRPPAARPVLPPRTSPIVIDAGHGGDDIGARSVTGLREKDLVLAVAVKLARELRSRGRAVRLTRTGDVTRALTDRAAFANRLGASVFVSLHANSSPVSAVRGAETYYMSLDHRATDEAAAATARKENAPAQGGGGRSTLDLILWDLAQAQVLNESARLALALQRRCNSGLEAPDRGVKQAPFVVLTGATMPAALVEVGFLSNPGEAELLAQPDYQQKVAEALASGIEDFLER